MALLTSSMDLFYCTRPLFHGSGRWLVEMLALSGCWICIPLPCLSRAVERTLPSFNHSRSVFVSFQELPTNIFLPWCEESSGCHPSPLPSDPSPESGLASVRCAPHRHEGTDPSDIFSPTGGYLPPSLTDLPESVRALDATSNELRLLLSTPPGSVPVLLVFFFNVLRPRETSRVPFQHQPESVRIRKFHTWTLSMEEDEGYREGCLCEPRHELDRPRVVSIRNCGWRLRRGEEANNRQSSRVP